MWIAQFGLLSMWRCRGCREVIERERFKGKGKREKQTRTNQLDWASASARVGKIKGDVLAFSNVPGTSQIGKELGGACLIFSWKGDRVNNWIWCGIKRLSLV